MKIIIIHKKDLKKYKIYLKVKNLPHMKNFLEEMFVKIRTYKKNMIINKNKRKKKEKRKEKKEIIEQKFKHHH